MKKFLFLVISILLIHANVNAQQQFEWEQYGLSFSVPSNFRVLVNTAESFEAQNNHVYLRIELLDYEGLSPEFMGTLLGEMANVSGMVDATVGELALTTLEGAYIEGIIDDTNVVYTILMDTESNLALLSSIVYEYGNGLVVENIMNSFAIR